MYRLENFANGYALVTGQLYRSNFKALDELSASSLVAGMNRPDVLGSLSAYRWQVETGGITHNDVPLHTDRESQTTIVLTAQQGTDEVWKGSDGNFYSLTALEIQSCADAVITHKRDCFKAEAQVANSINAITDHSVMESFDVHGEFDKALDTIKNPPA